MNGPGSHRNRGCTTEMVDSYGYVCQGAQMSRSRVLLVALLLAVVSIGCARAVAEPERPPHVAPPVAEVTGVALPLAAVGGDSPAGVVAQVGAWVEGVERGAWFDGVAAAEEAARMAAARQAANQHVASPGTGEGVGDCTGFAIPDAIIQRESGGNPYAVNSSSGAFGCAQVMPMHWAPGGVCADLDRWSVDDQRVCVDRLSQGGTRLSPWGM